MPLLPRNSLLNPLLTRPDWQKALPRSCDSVWLDKNENLDPHLLGFNESILREINPLNLSIYPECGELYRKIGRWLNVSPESILLAPGSDGAIRLTFEAFIDPGQIVVHTVPTFAMYPVYSQMFGAVTLPIGYHRDSRSPILDVQSLMDHLHANKPRLLCLPNPDSPTGTVIASGQLKEIIEVCRRQDTIVLIDEAYHPFYESTCVAWTGEFRNLIVARTFAKAWGLAGLRIGYAVGHPETMAYLHKLRPMYEVNSLGIAFMERVIDHPQQMLKSVKRLTEGKHFFSNEMAGFGFHTLETHGNFQHVAFGEKAPAVHAALEGKVLYRKDFNEECLRGYSRFSSTTVEQFAPIVEIIRSSVGQSFPGVNA